MIIFAVLGHLREMRVRNKVSKKEKESLSWRILIDKLSFMPIAGVITN